MIVAHAFGRTRSRLMGRLIYPSFGLVTMLGMLAPFMMEFLHWMRAPMALTFLGAIAGLMWIRRQRNGSDASTPMGAGVAAAAA